MTANTVNGSGNGARSGAQTLFLLATPLTCPILQALAHGPKQQGELRHAAGSPAQTTLRAQLKRLAEIRAVDKHRRNRFPGVLEYELTAAGHNLLAVVDVLGHWLQRAPGGPLALGSGGAKAAIKALAEGWSTMMIRALAAGPRSLTELDRLIASLSYPSLERRLGTMRLAGQLEARPSDGRGTPYGVTEWLRQGAAPLAAASHWERRHLADTAPPIGRVDVETTLLLAAPMLRLPGGLSGTCRLAADLPDGQNRRQAGAIFVVREGAIVSCSTDLNGSADAWALGPAAAWLGSVVEREFSGLELGGDCSLATLLLDSLHEALFRYDLDFQKVQPLT